MRRYPLDFVEPTPKEARYRVELAQQLVRLLGDTHMGELARLFTVDSLRVRDQRAQGLDSLIRRLEADNHSADLVHRSAVDVANDQPLEARVVSDEIRMTDAWARIANRVIDCGYIARANVFHDEHGDAWSSMEDGEKSVLRIVGALEPTAEAALEHMGRLAAYYEVQSDLVRWDRVRECWARNRHPPRS